MGRQIKGLLYFFINDVRYSFAIFWIILLSIVIVTEVITYFLVSVEDAFMTLSLTGPMYIYCFILGYLMVKEFIPFSLKVGATRKNIFLSTGIFFLLVALLKATIARVLAFIITAINSQIGIDSGKFMLLHLAQFLDDTWYNRFLIDVSIMFFGLVFMFLIGLLFYRYGLAGGGSVIGVIIILTLTGLAQGSLANFFVRLAKSFDMTIFYQLFGVGLILFLVSMIFLRNITIEKRK